MITIRSVAMLLMTLFLFACGQNKNQDKQVSFIQPDNPENRLAKYIEKPSDKDSMCIKEIERAKRDISKGRIVFCMPMGFGSFQLRQEEQIQQLCKKNNLVFEYETFSDVIISGQTQGCYGAYMDKVIQDKFGVGFKEKLLNKADGILLASNDTIVYYLCDKRPQIPGRDDYEIT